MTNYRTISIVLLAGLAGAVGWGYLGPRSAPETEARDISVEVEPAIEPEAPSVEPEPEPEIAPEPERIGEIELVRIAPDGSGLIAGRVGAMETVSIILEGEEIAQADPGVSGEFVAFVELTPSPEPRRVQLMQNYELLGASVIIAPIAAPAPLVVPQSAGPEVVETEVSEPEVAAVTEPEEPQTPAVMIADEEGVRVIQDGGDEVEAVALDAITYDPEGTVALSGRGKSASRVQVYLDNEPLVDGDVGGDGQWRIDLPDVDQGVYTLRVDEVDDGGAVMSRIETPFKREDPAEVAAVLADETSQEGFDLAVRTVQPGNTLWAIAQEAYGDGVLYVRVFEANADLIRDPNLIYPGQIFRLPESVEPN